MATKAALQEEGRGLRQQTPRKQVGRGFRTDRDPVDLLDAQNASRLTSLIPVRWGRMAESAFTFYRGAAGLMAHDLAPTPVTGIRVQACGDAHLSNFGFYSSPERTLVFDLNDFDETTIAPWEWDVERLVASMAVAAQAGGFGDNTAFTIAAQAAAAYRTTMRTAAGRSALDNYWTVVRAEALLERTKQLDAADATREIKRAKRAARGRTSETALRKLATAREDGGLRLVEQPPLMFRTEGLPESIADIPLRYLDTVPADIAALLAHFTPVDQMMRVVGVGSVGTRCAIVLLTDAMDAPLILQVKEATTSVLEAAAGASRYSHAGQRVVRGQRIMQAVSDPFLGWTSLGGRDYYVRQFRDNKGSFEIERLSVDLLAAYGRLCGIVLARAHAQSCEPALVAGYLGKGTAFDDAMAEFALAYAAQNAADYARFIDAIDSGRLRADREN